MQEFLKSKKFKALLCIFAMVFAFALKASYSQTAVPLISQLTGLLLTPLQHFSANLSYTSSEIFDTLFSGAKFSKENEDLRSENAYLRSLLVEYDRIKLENEQLKNYLDIKEKNPDFVFETAMVVGRNTSDRFFSFTIDKGSNDGISVDDPVITQEGVIGVISEVGINNAKVVTILDVAMEIGVMNTTTREIGVSMGTLALAQEGQLKMSYLARNSQTKAGDIIATTGVAGIFPRDMIIGTVTDVVADSRGLSLYAVVEPPMDIRVVRDVLVITNFAGQTNKADIEGD